MVGTSATDKHNPTNISWNGSALSLPAFLQKIRAPVLSHDPAFMTLIEKGIMINKSGITVHSVLQALAHKSGLRMKGTWDKPLEGVPVSPCCHLELGVVEEDVARGGWAQGLEFL